MSPSVLWNAFIIAATEIRRNLTRAMLTALGVLIGVGAVIAMVGLGEGATASIQSDLASIGNNMLIVTASTGSQQMRTQTPPFTERDAEAIRTQVPHVLHVAPATQVPATIAYGSAEVQTRVHGSTAAWFDVLERSIAQGRLPSEAEEKAGAGVCVIGATIQNALFDSESPLGAQIRVDSMSCQVIGIIEAKGANTMGMDQDDMVVAPLATVQRRLMGRNDVTSIFVSADHADHIDAAKVDIIRLMRQRRRLGPNSSDNFSITDTREMASMVTGITSLLTAFLGAVAGVSLLVGGIGIMNIMLVSVTERTREIGIRMAVGALERDVLTQFLVEAALISTLGGILGVILGLLGAFVGAKALGVGFVVNLPVTLGAVLFSALVGLGFGFYPARRAARMEPIDALRHT
jgi:putative ABC transport system permease protein